MKIFLFGVGNMTRITLQQIKKVPSDIDVLGFIDNDSNKWGSFLGKTVYGPRQLCETEFDNVIIMSDYYYQNIRENLIWWYKIDPSKIKDRKYFLKLLLTAKYNCTEDVEIQETLEYWKTHEISVFNQYEWSRKVDRRNEKWGEPSEKIEKRMIRMAACPTLRRKDTMEGMASKPPLRQVLKRSL